MYGDTLLFEPHQKTKANKIASFLFATPKLPTILAIHGVSGTSKSEIAFLLQKKLLDKGISSYCLSIDDYFLSHPVERRATRERTGIIGHKEINFKKLNCIIKDFRTRRESWVQEYYLFYKNLRHSRINFRLVDCLIIEGIYAGYINADNYVYLQASEKNTYNFRKTRGKENPDDPFRQKVLQIEREEVLLVADRKAHRGLTIQYRA
jgi:hypothetical protein